MSTAARHAGDGRRVPFGPALLVGILLLFAVAASGLFLGDVDIAPSEVIEALTHPSSTEPNAVIVRELRLPRVLVGLLAGAALASAGAALQALTGNPLADPTLAGVASGASVGVGAAVLLGMAGGAALPVMAFGGSVAATVLVMAASRRRSRLDLDSFLLSGLVLGTFLAAVMQLLLSLAGQDQSRILGWLMGYLGDSNLTQVAWLAASVLPGVCLLAGSGKALDAFCFGEDTARSIGVRVEWFKMSRLGVVALLTAVAVAATGIVGFVGLVVPHLIRSLVGPPNRRLVPLCALGGAILLSGADTLGRTVLPGRSLPVGVVTALIGAPAMTALLRRSRRG